MSARVLRLVLDLMGVAASTEDVQFPLRYVSLNYTWLAVLLMLDCYWSAATYQSSPASLLPNQFQ